MDPFETLGVEPRFDLDLTALEKRHRELSGALHPDRYTGRPASERRMALDRAIKVNEAWREAYFMDEMVKHPNEARSVSFARRGSDTRTTQIFINLKDNSADFDDQGFAPFGEVVEGFDEVIAKLSHEHGERPQQGDAPKRMMAEGAPFIKKEFPKLDWIKSAKLKE